MRLARSWLSATMLALLAAACAENSTAVGRRPAPATLAFTANVAGTTLSTLVVTVTASDITTPLVFNIQVTPGTNTATGTIKVPPGLQRTIDVSGYDSTGTKTYEGSKTIDVKPGNNSSISIPVLPLTGQVPITAVLGPVSITIAPISGGTFAGTTVQLTAAIVAPNGDTLAGPPEWATSNPALATVDQKGLVTLIAVGTVDITAVYDGVAAVVHLTINDPLVYKSNFASGVLGPEWSDSAEASDWKFALNTSPTGKVILGPLSNGRAVLTLHNLPPHTSVTVALDFYAIGTLDGNAEFGGGTPAEVFYFGSSVGTYLQTNFSNESNETQAFPQSLGAKLNSGNSSVAHNVLGYPNGDFEYRIGPAYPPTSAWVFAHTDSTVQIGIEANWLEALSNESWGIDNVSVWLR